MPEKEKRCLNMMPNKDNLIDPEPISIALGMFGVLVGGANLIVNLVRSRREKRRYNNSLASDFYKADRSLNSLDEAYRSLVSIYGEHGILTINFSPGWYNFYIDRSTAAEIRKIQQNIFDAGRNLQKALEELPYSEYEQIGEDYDSLLKTTENLFKDSLKAEYMFDFMIQLGLLIIHISKFLYEFGHRFGFEHELDSSKNRMGLIEGTLDILKKYKRIQ